MNVAKLSTLRVVLYQDVLYHKYAGLYQGQRLSIDTDISTKFEHTNVSSKTSNYRLWRCKI